MSDWIKIRGDSDTLTTFCERCGESFTLKLPVSVTMLALLAKSFMTTHRKCRAMARAEHVAGSQEPK